MTNWALSLSKISIASFATNVMPVTAACPGTEQMAASTGPVGSSGLNVGPPSYEPWFRL